jgi:hypothetical protein
VSSIKSKNPSGLSIGFRLRGVVLLVLDVGGISAQHHHGIGPLLLTMFE